MGPKKLVEHKLPGQDRFNWRHPSMPIPQQPGQMNIYMPSTSRYNQVPVDLTKNLHLQVPSTYLPQQPELNLKFYELEMPPWQTLLPYTVPFSNLRPNQPSPSPNPRMLPQANMEQSVIFNCPPGCQHCLLGAQSLLRAIQSQSRNNMNQNLHTVGYPNQNVHAIEYTSRNMLNKNVQAIQYPTRNTMNENFNAAEYASRNAFNQNVHAVEYSSRSTLNQTIHTIEYSTRNTLNRNLQILASMDSSSIQAQQLIPYIAPLSRPKRRAYTRRTTYKQESAKAKKNHSFEYLPNTNQRLELSTNNNQAPVELMATDKDMSEENSQILKANRKILVANRQAFKNQKPTINDEQDTEKNQESVANDTLIQNDKQDENKEKPLQIDNQQSIQNNNEQIPKADDQPVKEIKSVENNTDNTDSVTAASATFVHPNFGRIPMYIVRVDKKPVFIFECKKNCMMSNYGRASPDVLNEIRRKGGREAEYLVRSGQIFHCHVNLDDTETIKMHFDAHKPTK